MATTHYCWRCRADVPMLTDEEWEEVAPLLSAMMKDLKRFREETGASLDDALLHQNPLSPLAKYYDLTGYRETNVNAIWHHRLSKFGPPCSACGKLLRTPRARFCAECGRTVV